MTPLLRVDRLRLHALSDERLAALVVDGEDAAFEVLMGRHHRRLLGLARAILQNDEDAADAVQRAMLAAYRHLPHRPYAGPVRPWLHRVVHHQALDLLRRRRAWAPLDEEAPAPTAGTAAHEVREELREVLADVARLPSRRRAALLLREVSGLEYDDIGAALDTTGGGARNLVHKARLELHELRDGRRVPCARTAEAVLACEGRRPEDPALRAHLRGCEACAALQAEARARRRALRALIPSPLLAGIGATVTGWAGGAAGTAVKPLVTVAVVAGAVGVTKPAVLPPDPAPAAARPARVEPGPVARAERHAPVLPVAVAVAERQPPQRERQAPARPAHPRPAAPTADDGRRVFVRRSCEGWTRAERCAESAEAPAPDQLVLPRAHWAARKRQIAATCGPAVATKEWGACARGEREEAPREQAAPPPEPAPASPPAPSPAPAPAAAPAPAEAPPPVEAPVEAPPPVEPAAPVPTDLPAAG